MKRAETTLPLLWPSPRALLPNSLATIYWMSVILSFKTLYNIRSNHNNQCSFSNYSNLYENVIQTHTSALTHFYFNAINDIDINVLVRFAPRRKMPFVLALWVRQEQQVYLYLDFPKDRSVCINRVSSTRRVSDHDYEGNTIFQNFGRYSKKLHESRPRRLETSATLLPEQQFSRVIFLF